MRCKILRESSVNYLQQVLIWLRGSQDSVFLLLSLTLSASEFFCFIDTFLLLFFFRFILSYEIFEQWRHYPDLITWNVLIFFLEKSYF